MRALSLRAYSEVIRKCNTLSTEQVTYSKHTEFYINLIKSTSNIYMGLDGADCIFYFVKMKIYFRLVVCIEMLRYASTRQNTLRLQTCKVDKSHIDFLLGSSILAVVYVLNCLKIN